MIRFVFADHVVGKSFEDAGQHQLKHRKVSLAGVFRITTKLLVVFHDFAGCFVSRCQPDVANELQARRNHRPHFTQATECLERVGPIFDRGKVDFLALEVVADGLVDGVHDC